MAGTGPPTFRLEVQRANHYTTAPHKLVLPVLNFCGPFFEIISHQLLVKFVPYVVGPLSFSYLLEMMFYFQTT